MKTNDKCVSNWLSSGLWGIIPVYYNNGCNGSRLLFRNGPPLTDKRKIKSILKDLAAYYQKTPELIKKHAAALTGLRTMNPLPVTADIILIPVKTRKPIGANDGAIGYIFLNAVSSVSGDKGGSVLVLNDNSKINILENINTLKRRLSLANMMYKAVSLPSCFSGGDVVLKEASAQYDKPATKGDIYMLSQSMLNFINLITYIADEKALK